MKSSNRTRLVIFTFLVSTVVGMATVWQATAIYRQTTTQLSETVFESALENAIQDLNYYTDSVNNDLLVVASNGVMIKAINSFDSAFSDLGANPEQVVQKLYIEDNPHPVGQKDQLMRANDESEYSTLHGDYHPWFKNFVAARDYYDLFLINPKGDIVYTVFKEEDLGTNVLTGLLKGTALQSLFSRLLESPSGIIVATDFEPYAPSNGLPAAFAGIPIYSDDEIIGTLIVQLRLDPFNRLTRNTSQLGETGEVYLVGPDFLMRTQSRFIEDSILTTEVESDSVKQALAGASGMWRINDYRGEPVLSAYSPFDWSGGRWAAIAEQDVAEVQGPIDSFNTRLILIAIACVFVSCLLAYVLAATTPGKE